MVKIYNQNEFNDKFCKEKQWTNIEFDEDFQGTLIIEDYPKLEKLYLFYVNSIDKLILRNLGQLRECTVLNCGTAELVIESCSKIEKLNVQDNSLTSLEFIKDLENLAKLEIDSNPKLIEILKTYQNDWRVYRERVQEIVRLAKKNPQKLLDLQEKNEKYDILKEALTSFSIEIQEQVKEKEVVELTNRIEDTKKMVTQDLMFMMRTNLGKLKKWKEEKEVELEKLKKEKIGLETGLIKEKEEQLEKLEKEFISKGMSFGKKEKKLQDDLKIYLDASNSQFAREKSKERLLNSKTKWLSKKEKENPELAELLKELWGKQISLLEVKGETIREIRSKDIIDISYELEKSKVEEINPDVILRKQVSNPSNSESKQSEKYTFKKSKTRTWNNSFGVEMEINISVTTGIPALAEGKIVLNPKVNYACQKEDSETEESSIESASEFDVPANSKGEIIISAKRVKMSVPFKYIERITYKDGETEEVIKDGIYEGVESFHDIKVDLKTEKIVEQSNAQQEIPSK